MISMSRWDINVFDVFSWGGIQDAMQNVLHMSLLESSGAEDRTESGAAQQSFGCHSLVVAGEANATMLKFRNLKIPTQTLHVCHAYMPTLTPKPLQLIGMYGWQSQTGRVWASEMSLQRMARVPHLVVRGFRRHGVCVSLGPQSGRRRRRQIEVGAVGWRPSHSA